MSDELNGAGAGTAFADRTVDLPPEVLEVCEAASDPLEIAAALEVSGASHTMLAHGSPDSDLFSLARRLFSETPFRFREVGLTRPLPRAGRPEDVARGIMFAAPSLVFAASIKGLSLRLEWWSLPLALICGWSLGQATAAIGFALEGRRERAGAAAIWAIGATAVVTFALACLGHALFGGGSFTNAAVLAVLSTYVTACAVLGIYDELKLMALALAPSVVVAAVYLTGVPVRVPGLVAAAFGGVTIVATVVMALRHIRGGSWHFPRVQPSDVASGVRYLLHGVSCGLFVSFVVVLSSTSNSPGSRLSLVGYPIVLTLGMIEWQLRSYRSHAQNALQATDLALFARRAWGAFLRSLFSYVGAQVVASVAVGALIATHDHGVPAALLLAQGAMGCAFFVALVLGSCARMDLVLQSWLAGLTCFLGCVVIDHFANGMVTAGAARLFCAASAMFVFVCLLVNAKGVVSAAPSYP